MNRTRLRRVEKALRELMPGDDDASKLRRAIGAHRQGIPGFGVSIVDQLRLESDGSPEARRLLDEYQGMPLEAAEAAREGRK